MRKFTGKKLDLISYPLGGTGAGMLCMTGTGRFGSISLRHKPDIHHCPNLFGAVTILGEAPVSRVLEAPFPDHMIFAAEQNGGNGGLGRNWGLPRFSKGEFSAQFPFATLALTDESLPLSVTVTGWSPFIPNNEDNSGMPFAAVEYDFTNTGENLIEAVCYFNSVNFMSVNDDCGVRAVENGFVLEQRGSVEAPHLEGAFCVSADQPAYVDTAWFRGGGFDSVTMLWNGISKGVYKNARHSDPENGPAPGASIAVPFCLDPGESRTIKLRFSWYVPYSDLRYGNSGCEGPEAYYAPWYASAVGSIDEANALWSEKYDYLYGETKKFTTCFYDSTLPDEILETVSANLCILKSPTILRQTDGRLWGWEGCEDGAGSCAGSCTHVWNYAQALCNLFPRLERTLRKSEFYESQDDETGHQQFRTFLPIRKAVHDFYAAGDGQLGGIIKVYRDWRISGDTEWLRGIWPRVRQSLEYCINQWDPDREGVIKQPHHNTYDIEFWGPDGMCTSFYLGALKAACETAAALGEDFSEYTALYEKGRAYLENQLFNGEYFYQRVMWRDLNTELDITGQNAEAAALLQSEGPKYQYGNGCLSDGVLGFWLAEISGLNDLIDDEKLRKNLCAIYRHNFKKNLSAHENPQRPGYAMKNEAGLLLCTWPYGGKPSLPFIYSDEVWTGIEHHVASHLLSKGYLREGLDIVRACRSRYDGTVRNPYNEYECGHWYARAMSSYALLQGYTGVRYDAVTKTLYYSNRNTGSYKTFLSTASGYGTVEVDGDTARVTIVSGSIEINNTVRLV